MEYSTASFSSLYRCSRTNYTEPDSKPIFDCCTVDNNDPNSVYRMSIECWNRFHTCTYLRPTSIVISPDVRSTKMRPRAITRSNTFPVKTHFNEYNHELYDKRKYAYSLTLISCASTYLISMHHNVSISLNLICNDCISSDFSDSVSFLLYKR